MILQSQQFRSRAKFSETDYCLNKLRISWKLKAACPLKQNKLLSAFDRKSWSFFGEGSRFWTRSIKSHIYCLSWIKTKFYALSADFLWAGSNFMDLRRTLLTFRNMTVIALILIIVNGLPFHHARLSNKYRDLINKVQRISSVEDFDIPIIHSYQLHVFNYLL